MKNASNAISGFEVAAQPLYFYQDFGFKSGPLLGMGFQEELQTLVAYIRG
jgi:hypothetical protein